MMKTILAAMAAVALLFGPATAMISVGLISAIEDKPQRYVPTAPPTTAWETLPLPAATIAELRDNNLAEEELQDPDVIGAIDHLARWSPAGVLTATPEAIAMRLATSPEQILRALQHPRPHSNLSRHRLGPGHRHDADAPVHHARDGGTSRRHPLVGRLCGGACRPRTTGGIAARAASFRPAFAP